MKKVLSQYKSLLSISEEEIGLVKSFNKVKKELEKKQTKLQNARYQVYRNKKKFINVIKYKLLLLIPKRDKKAHDLFTKEISVEDLVGNTILEILLFEAYPIPVHPWNMITIPIGKPTYGGKFYDFYLEESWFFKHSEKQIDLEFLYKTLKRVYSKYWKDYIEMELEYQIQHQDRYNKLFMSMKIL